MERKISFSFPKHSFTLDNKYRIDNLHGKITSILLRRPGKPYEFYDKKKVPQEHILEYISNQWHSFLSGLKSLPNVLWINDPFANAYAEVKINQLTLAQKAGFTIPKTCITNDIDILKLFWEQCEKKMIAKALNTPLIKNNNKEFFIFTNKIKTIENIKSDELSIAPTIFQEAIEKKVDYRITVVGDSLFSVKIKTSNTTSIDWRQIKNHDQIKYVKTIIPNDIKEKCIKLVSRLGLVFGAIDVIKNNDNDKFYFLEINPNGEWGWLQKNAKLPIAEALVNKLLEGRK